MAAGSGHRFGGPKQFRVLGHKTVLEWSVDTAASASTGVVVAVPASEVAATRARLEGGASTGKVRVVAGGITRSDSVRNGLQHVPASAEIVLVHDGARPLATKTVFRRVIAIVDQGSDAAVPTVPVTDTLRHRDGSHVDRSELLAVQTPQAFRAKVLRQIHTTIPQATDDASLVTASGGKVTAVQGDPTNLKITEPHDLAIAEVLLATTGPESHEGRPEERVGVGDSGAVASSEMRVGQGFDVHRYSNDAARPLVLGGVTFEGEQALDGHSDADVVAHACTDALLAAAGLDDIGQMFSDADPTWKNADSIDLLRRAVAEVRQAGWEPSNVSCTVVLDTPKIAPVREQMQLRLGSAVGAPVSVTGRRSEGIGALGRREGVAAWAVALVSRQSTGPNNKGLP